MQVTKVAWMLAAKPKEGELDQKLCTVMALLDGGMLTRHKSWLKAEPPAIVVATVGSLCQMLEKQMIKLESMLVLNDAIRVHVNPVQPMPSCFYSIDLLYAIKTEGTKPCCPYYSLMHRSLQLFLLASRWAIHSIKVISNRADQMTIGQNIAHFDTKLISNGGLGKKLWDPLGHKSAKWLAGWNKKANKLAQFLKAQMCLNVRSSPTERAMFSPCPDYSFARNYFLMNSAMPYLYTISN